MRGLTCVVKALAWSDEDKREIVMSVGIAAAPVTQMAQRHESTLQQI
ncbi:hypothetical protein [Yoonia sp.]|nr:hypothetical protein [Yoonia sp.]